METIAERLSTQENLYFPQAIQSNTKDPCQRKAVLLDLLSRDVALFLGTLGYFSASNQKTAMKATEGVGTARFCRMHHANDQNFIFKLGY